MKTIEAIAFPMLPWRMRKKTKLNVPTGLPPTKKGSEAQTHLRTAILLLRTTSQNKTSRTRGTKRARNRGHSRDTVPRGAGGPAPSNVTTRAHVRAVHNSTPRVRGLCRGLARQVHVHIHVHTAVAGGTHIRALFPVPVHARGRQKSAAIPAADARIRRLQMREPQKHRR